MRIRATMALGLFAISTILTSCQTPEQSATSAEMTCQSQGLRPGTQRYSRCVGATYQANRSQAQQAENQAAAGIAAGVIGGVLVGAAVSDNHHRGYYGRPYYRRCYRCW
ncbi:hypothetical protein MOV66_14675 [Agrobacterium sp. SHOUNA12C]|uniref:Glycine zipper domain-containing protein n=2 Tax=Rhizobium rhizogenes TaxID=359 RepID=B9JCZ4_RHIR8|nr:MULTISPECIES: hypothetical protein [Rhizobium]ACM26131.1 hypothetical protein Arad_1778 [Rhizobium rhizogenes K84]KAA6491053.1 hypothetical protein DXT98_02585 [Agrobacterium sp. ICMP 7243]MCJ9721749.1 hypothetical protein [Agrobacterium sp. BETTINA12B]MCJ9757890.1 hypothetical protein [Agrobacterium sp. SHOUNA12C]OCJ06510.1 hypothetical protein A6U85_06115 [Agrobacterium sp. 13-626]OCJ25223.1 hypothetical protein A6U88_01725 [Agrobacterium sp. B131/95]OCJ31621.1 hypothetical protein A6U8